MWAFGVLAFVTVYKTCPFHYDHKAIYDHVNNQDRARAAALKDYIKSFLEKAVPGDIPWPHILPQAQVREINHIHLQQLLQKLWKLDPKLRLTSTQTVDFFGDCSQGKQCSVLVW